MPPSFHVVKRQSNNNQNYPDKGFYRIFNQCIDHNRQAKDSIKSCSKNLAKSKLLITTQNSDTYQCSHKGETDNHKYDKGQQLIKTATQYQTYTPERLQKYRPVRRIKALMQTFGKS